MLEALASGATGIWCGVSREGAAVGHCSSTVTLTNLARLGNKNILKQFSIPALRAAAVAVTRSTTGHDPNEHEEVCSSLSMQTEASV